MTISLVPETQISVPSLHFFPNDATLAYNRRRASIGAEDMLNTPFEPKEEEELVSIEV